MQIYLELLTVGRPISHDKKGSTLKGTFIQFCGNLALLFQKSKEPNKDKDGTWECYF